MANDKGPTVIQVFLAILVAALAYWVCLALGLPAIVGIIAAVIVLLGAYGGTSRL
jgi:hypothetical protein